MGELRFDEDLMDEIASNLDLREPNREAAESVVICLSEHIDVLGRPGPFTGIVDAATAVGKTYTAAAVIDYLAQARGWSNFLIVVPGSVTRTKTIDTFTPGTDRTLLPQMVTANSSAIALITADNIGSASTRQAMDDPDTVCIYVMTIHGLVAPASEKAGKRTHDDQEWLGGAFFDRLSKMDDLVVIADEHHDYSGKKFSRTLADLDPVALIGLTATPLKADEKNVVYRYPLAAAIADRYVKAPVIVGRTDDLTDVRARLMDGIAALDKKREVAEREAKRLGRRINPVMLVVATGIEQADEIAATLRSPNFLNGRLSDAVLVVHSEAKNASQDDMEVKTAEVLAGVESPDSAIRVIVSVGMLRQGWDVTNVYVLMSTRPQVSEVLTEQVLGRGLRLPYGRWVEPRMLNTLDVIAHEKFDTLLKNAGVINEGFISHREWVKARHDEEGTLRLLRESVEVTIPDGAKDGIPVDFGAYAHDIANPDEHETRPPVAPAVAVDVMGARERLAELERQAKEDKAPKPVGRSAHQVEVRIPVVVRRLTPNEFSLTEIDKIEPFRALGRQIAVDPSGALRRTMLDAKVETHAGVKKVSLVTVSLGDDPEDVISASQRHMSVQEATEVLTDAVMASEIVSPRAETRDRERRMAKVLVEAFIDGLNGDAPTLLGAYLDRSRGALLKELARVKRSASAEEKYAHDITWTKPDLTRESPREVSTDLVSSITPISAFRSTAFTGWNRSLFEADWFDTHPERDMANLLDTSSNPIKWWLRLQGKDLVIPVLDGANYEPDFLAEDNDGTRWVIEVKGDDRMGSQDVESKRRSAKRWVNIVNTNLGDGESRWAYLLVSEADLKEAKGDWNTLARKLA